MSINTDSKGLANDGKGFATDGIGWADAQALQQLANQFFKAGSGNAPDAAYSIQADKAGSGVSPLAIERGDSFDIKDPQSSLPDPHFEDGKVPTAVAGSGRSIGIQEQARPSSLPVSKVEGHEYAGGVKEALDRISSFSPVPQIPVNDAKGTGYYFLKESNPWRAAPNALPGARDMTAYVNGHIGLTRPPFDVAAIRKDFPILSELINGRPLIWLDNAATTQKPRSVIDRLSSFYSHENSNIHRAAHELAARATDAYEGARKKVQGFLNAASVNEIVFVRGATEAINLVAKSWGEQYLGSGDEIVVSHLEHHANIVPWQQLAEKKGCKLNVIPVDEDGQILLNEYAKLLNSKTRLVAVTQVSNALGTITPVKQIAEMAHTAGVKVLVDGAQSVSHMPVDVQDLGADWFVFSGHKVFAPTGIGVLYGREALLNMTQPWQGGGNMIKDVTFEHTQFHNAPGRFEAGTGNIADAVGLGAAIDYVTTIGMDLIGTYEHYLLVYATRLLKNVPGLRLIGTAPDKASVLSFVLEGFTNDQVGQALNKEGIAVRTGHHCAQPILRRFGLESTVRPSLAFYNTCAEIDTLVSVLHRLRTGR
jgi:cysteine desulfurase / selenocysteine lyase